MSRAYGLAAALIVGLLSGCVVPLRPDAPEYDRFAPSSHSPPVALSVLPLRVAHQSGPRCASAGAASCFQFATSVYVSYLVKHPQATFLIDATLSTNGREDLRRLPLPARLALNFTSERSLGEALAEAGSPRVDFVLLTHAHWDHTSGLADLDRPRTILAPEEVAFVQSLRPGERSTVIRDHLRREPLETFRWDGPPFENFPKSHDLFGDGSVVLVPLPGHTPGSIGIFLNAVKGRRLFFIGDAGWSMDAIDLPSHKLRPVSALVDANRDTLSETLWRLHHLHEREPDLLMVPAHDSRAFDAVSALAK